MSRLSRLLSATVVAAALLAPTVFAARLDPFDWDLRLVHALNQRRMHDYAAYQLDRMSKRYPDQVDPIKLARGRTFMLMGKAAEGEALLRQLDTSSPLHQQAQLALAELAYVRGDLETAGSVYKAYFSRTKRPASERDSDVQDFKGAVVRYANILKKQGKGSEAAKVMDYLGAVGSGGASERQLTFLRAQTLLDTEEAKYPKVDKNQVAKALKELEPLKWRVDGVAAAAYVELARAYVLLDKHDDAITLLTSSGDMMRQIESNLPESARASASPMAGAFFVYGRALKGKARIAFKSNKPAEAKPHLVAALKRFYVVSKKYGASPYRSKALVEFGKCKSLLETKLDTKVELKAGAEESTIELKMEQARAQMAAKRFDAAAPLYLEAARVARNSESFLDVAPQLVTCYGKLGKALEAETLISFMTERFPENPKMADALLRFGAALYQNSNAEQDATAKATQLEQALAVWDRFVDAAPSHPKAAPVAFLIAETTYKQAANLAKTARTQSGDEKTAATEQARERYLSAVPKYQRLVDQYGSFPKGIRSLYKLGWIYYSTAQPTEAVDAFLKYVTAEEDSKYQDDRLQAKFRAAEQLMLNDRAAEAAPHFEELYAWLQPGADAGFNLKTKTALKLAEDAASYAGWSHDLAAEKIRRDLTESETRARAAKEERRQLAKRQNSTAESLATAKEASKETLARSAARQKQLQTPLPDLETLKQAELTKVGVDKMTAQERGFAETKALDNAKRLIAGMQKTEQERLLGEKLELQEERTQLEARLKSAIVLKARLANELKTAKAAHEQADARRTTLTAKIAELTAAAETATQELETARKNRAAAEEALRALRDQRMSRDVAERRSAARRLPRARWAVQVAAKRFGAASNVFKNADGPEARKSRRHLKLQLTELELQSDAQQREAVRLQRDLQIAVADAEALQSELRAVSAAQKFNKEMQTFMKTPVDQRGALAPDLNKRKEALLTQLATARDQRTAEITLRTSLLQEAQKIDAARDAELAKAIAEAEKMQAPIREKVLAVKRLAQQRFVAFLKAYPKSSHVPENMSRLGSIHIEFEEFDQAARYLNRLATEYPDSDAGKLALFNLGRALIETGDFKAAADAFGKIDLSSSDQPTSNLSFISEKMLEHGFPELSREASLELVARSNDTTHADYAYLQRVRENALFRAAEASYRMTDYAATIAQAEQLLQEKPNSGYFFDANFMLGMARRLSKPADYEAAVKNFNDILLYAQDPVVANRAICMLGETHALIGGQEQLKLAVARFQQVVLLADKANPANQEWIERAYYQSARAYARLGETSARDKAVADYVKSYPKGQYASDIRSLPAAEFKPTPPPAAE